MKARSSAGAPAAPILPARACAGDRKVRPPADGVRSKDMTAARGETHRRAGARRAGVAGGALRVGPTSACAPAPPGSDRPVAIARDGARPLGMLRQLGALPAPAEAGPTAGSGSTSAP